MNEPITMRAKMEVESITIGYGNMETVTMKAVCKHESYPADGKDDDNTYALWTPAGEISLSITNPALHGKFKPGQKFYLDFTQAVDTK
jgi:hypothetical protein